MNAMLQGIDLTDSWVLGWKQSDGALEFSVEFSIWPGSSFYQPPKKNEWTCYRRGLLRFEGVTAIDGLKKEESVRSTTDSDGSTDYGNIESFKEGPDRVRLSGDFGEVLVGCSSWKVEIL